MKTTQPASDYMRITDTTIPVDQKACARDIPAHVFETAKVCRFAFPTATREHIAQRIADYYGFTDPDARFDFWNAILQYLNKNA